MYTRAAASDYDDWATKFGNEGWSSKDLLPLLQKTETYQVKKDAPTHGYNGPLKVSLGGHYTNIGKQFLEVAAKFDGERGTTEDANGLFSCNSYGVRRKPRGVGGLNLADRIDSAGKNGSMERLAIALMSPITSSTTNPITKTFKS